MSIASLVMAAGSGDRFGGPKQFATLTDRTRLVDRAVATARAASVWVGVVLPPGAEWDGDPIDGVCSGGPSRQASIESGLTLLGAEVDVVLIHSASHPLASVKLAAAAIAAVEAGADAAVPWLPLVDVLKRSDGGQLTTFGREGLGLAQSPMAFARPMLERAFRSGRSAVEESELVEKLGGRVVAVDGEATNIHVVDRRSLAVARAIAALPPFE